MIEYLTNNLLCASLIGLLALMLGYFFAKDNCNSKDDTKIHT